MRLLRSLPVLFLLSLAVCSAPAAAHPLGNFTINHLARVSVYQRELHVRYILDIAEIPTFQIMHARADGAWDEAIMQRWAGEERSLVVRGIDLRIDGAPVTLMPGDATAQLRPGAGGLPILRWVGSFAIPLNASPHRVVMRDNVYADRRIGWKDIVVGAQIEPTNELRRYPSALIGTPQRVNAAQFDVAGGRLTAIRTFEDQAPPITSTTSLVRPTLLSDMFSRPHQTPLFVVLTMLAAFGLGALHAAEPGHGKALLAFTLVGARATAKQAFILAGSLTAAHTIGVFVLGLVLLVTSAFVSESIYPAITLLCGAVIAVIGARTLARARHDVMHGHGHHHAHTLRRAQGSSIPQDDKNISFSSAVWAAMSGGIAPCPAAIVVLLAAVRLHHVGYGMLLIVIFSLGLASVLTGLGLLVVRGASWISQRSGYARFAPYAPFITASVISIIGAVMLSQALTQEGVNAPAPLLAFIALIAITGYAFAQHTHPHSHIATEVAST